jgi:hypothetical protein
MALRDRGAPVEYLLAEDEGHGFARPVNNMAAFAAMEKFFSTHLKGRYQEFMGTEVSDRLKAITVDPKTVKTTTTISAAAAGVPKTSASLKPGVASYQAKIELGAQSMSATLTTEIKEEGGDWVVTETAKLPTGDATDRVVLARDTLVVKKRSITQGPVTIDLAVNNGKATGEMKMGAQPRPINLDLGGDLFADGPGAADAIGALPLAEGYTTTYRNLDFRTMQVRTVQLKVAGSEQVTVAAGTFEAFKIEMTGSDGGKTTLWVAKSTREPVKQVTVSPAMNGATITAERQK